MKIAPFLAALCLLPVAINAATFDLVSVSHSLNASVVSKIYADETRTLVVSEHADVKTVSMTSQVPNFHDSFEVISPIVFADAGARLTYNISANHINVAGFVGAWSFPDGSLFHEATSIGNSSFIATFSISESVRYNVTGYQDFWDDVGVYDWKFRLLSLGSPLPVFESGELNFVYDESGGFLITAYTPLASSGILAPGQYAFSAVHNVIAQYNNEARLYYDVNFAVSPVPEGTSTLLLSLLGLTTLIAARRLI